MFKKYFSRKKNKSVHDTVERDSVPTTEVANPIPIQRNHQTFGQDSSHLVSSSLSPQSTTPVIQMSFNNSHGFHVGDINNITVTKGSVLSLNSNKAFGLENLNKNVINRVESTTPPSNNGCHNLEYVYDKIKDWEISMISDLMDKDWRSLGEQLDYTSEELRNLEEKYGQQYNLAVRDILQKYVEKYPDTSIGFIASILTQQGYHNIVRQISKLHS